MAAIDSRATITCNLGEVISGGISDSYLQNSGLVFTKGQLTLVGTQTPQVGSSVTIGYEMASGASGSIPRSLVVLSAFVDPFRGTTEVSVGCMLTYLDGVMPVPSLEDGDASYVGPRQLECLNGLTKSAFIPPIFADDLFSYCKNRLGLSGSSGSLSNAYMMEKYDLSGGYISAIGNLLLSEGKCGYASETGGLTVLNLSDPPSGSRSLNQDDIIDVSGINNGELPASIVIVPYIDKNLQTYEPDEAKWEEVVSIGDPESVKLQYTGGSINVSHTPVTRTVTEYGPPNDLTDRCELKDGGFGDLSDTVVKTTTTRSTCVGHAAGGYVTQMLEAGLSVNASLAGQVKEITSHEFDDKDRPTRVITETFEPFFVYAGRMSLQWVLPDETYVSLGNELVLTERTIEEQEYAGEANIPEGFRPGQDVPEPVVYQRTHRYTYQAWGKTQGGSQGPAESTTLEAFTTAAEVLDYVQGSLGLVLTDSVVISNKAFNPKGQRRPGEADRAVEQGTLDNAGRQTKYVELQFQDSGTGTRVVQYSPPHLGESYFAPSGIAVNVDTYAVSARFGRVQHRLAMGNRLGMNVTTTPDKLDAKPYSGLTVSAAGFTATYAVNGMNYSFSRDGIVVSCDALYIGGNGLTTTRRKARALGSPWFYLPDGYDPANLPLASEGQLITPFNERVNVRSGVRLGTLAVSQTAQALIPQEVEIGVALGVNGNQLYRQVAEVGVAAGVEATGSLAFLATVQLGVALGANTIVKLEGVRTAELGVAVGVNVGPAPLVPALLMHFDDAPDFAENVWTDSSPNALTITNTAEGSFSTLALPTDPDFGLVPRFGTGFVGFFSGGPNFDTIESRGGLLSERTTALNFGDEWTIEFWIKVVSDEMPDPGQFRTPWTVFLMDSAVFTAPIELELVFDQATGTAKFEASVYDGVGEFLQTLEGAQLVTDEWLHIALVKTMSGVRLFQNGIRQGGISGTNVTTVQVDRIAIGGWLDKDDTTIRNNHGVFELDELRILNNGAAYDITQSTITVPTGPFSD